MKTEYEEENMKKKTVKTVKGCSGCVFCPSNLEEYGIAQNSPATYCPDAYSDRAQYCGKYDNTKLEKR